MKLNLRVDTNDSFREPYKRIKKSNLNKKIIFQEKNLKNKTFEYIPPINKFSRNPIKIDLTNGNESTDNTIDSPNNFSSFRENENKSFLRQNKRLKSERKKTKKNVELREDSINKVIERNKIKFNSTFHDISTMINNKYKTKKNWYYQSLFDKMNNSNIEISKEEKSKNKDYDKRAFFRKTMTISYNNKKNNNDYFSGIKGKRRYSKNDKKPKYNKIIEKNKILENARQKTEKLLFSIENMLNKEYEELNYDKGTYSVNNLCRVINLIGIIKHGKTVEEDEFFINKKKMINFMKNRIHPRLLKIDFRKATVEKFKSMKGLGFGSYRNKNDEYKEMVGPTFLRNKSLD